MEHTVVFGAGVMGLSATEALLQHAALNGVATTVTIVADRFGDQTDSKSGGAVMPFLNSDPRVPKWTRESAHWYTEVLPARRPTLTKYLVRHGTLLASRRDRPIEVPGHLGAEHLVSPVEFGLGSFYRSAACHMDGLIINTCALLPEWTRLLESDPQVRMVRGTFTRSTLAQLARRLQATRVIFAPGYRAQDPHLADDGEVAAVEGILLSGKAVSPGSCHSQYFVVDEDDSDELTYTIPHTACSTHKLIVGGSAVEVPWRALPEEQRLTRQHDRLIDEILDRVQKRFPDLRWQPQDVWIGYRPARNQMRCGLMDLDFLDGIPTVALYGSGGSGWTIAPGAVREALNSSIYSVEQTWSGC